MLLVDCQMFSLSDTSACTTDTNHHEVPYNYSTALDRTPFYRQKDVMPEKGLCLISIKIIFVNFTSMKKFQIFLPEVLILFGLWRSNIYSQLTTQTKLELNQCFIG